MTFIKTLIYKLLNKQVSNIYNKRFDSYNNNRITPEDCKEQIRSWAQKLAEREAEKTPIGKKKVKLLQLKEDAISDVMESGMPAELIDKLGQRLKVIGIAWNNNVKQIGNNLN